MNIFFDWNIALDERGGPNHVGNYCDASVICDTVEGTYKKNLIFEYISHFSNYIKPGAKRIAFTKYAGSLEVIAAKNPGGDLAAVIVNKLPQPQKIVLRLNGRQAEVELDGDSIATICVTS
jgi:glucosylceramidase